MSNIIQSKQLCSVNDEKRICFINIPKNASQTIMKNLKFDVIQKKLNTVEEIIEQVNG